MELTLTKFEFMLIHKLVYEHKQSLENDSLNSRYPDKVSKLNKKIKRSYLKQCKK